MVRGILAILVALLGSVLVLRATGYVARSGNTGMAYRLAPGDGRIVGLYAQDVSDPATGVDRVLADRLARQALVLDPTAVAAVVTLGTGAQTLGDTAAAQRLFAYSERLSRRDLRTQVWAIQNAAARNDLAATIRHFDIALRTVRNAPGLLFPILAVAINDPDVRTALIAKLVARPGWMPHFINYAASEGKDPLATVRLFDGLRRAHVPVSETASVMLVDRLIGDGRLEDAWSYYASFRPGADRRASRDPRFTKAGTLASLLDWQLVDTPGVMMSIQGGDRSGVVDFAVAPTIAGTMLKQMQMLPAGPYRLEGHGVGPQPSDGSRLYWSLTCREGREIGRVAMPLSAQGKGAFAGVFVVPAGCPVQMLSLVTRPSDAMTELTGQIDRVRLTPAR